MDSSFKLESDVDILPTATSPQGLQPHRTLLAKSTVQSFPWKSSTVIFIGSTTISAFVVILALKLNVLSQSSPNRIVDVDNCTCDCWDRAFKGGYHPGGYKHIYFQMTYGSSLLWLWSALHFGLLLKFVELATVCVLGTIFSDRRTPKIRWLVLFSSCLNFYGMFYNWWITFNYINDAGPHQSYHILLSTQLFFDITDVIPAVALYNLLQEGGDLPSTHLLLASIIVSATHVILSAWDQGFIHLLTLDGAVLRDAMFIVSDLAGLIGVGWFIRGGLRSHRKLIGLGIIALLSSYLALKWMAGYR